MNLPEPSPVDLDRLNDWSDGDTAYRSQIITMFLAQTTRDLEKVREQIAAGSPEDVRSISHSAAGAGETCGMTAVSAALRQLEKLGFEKNLSSAPEALNLAERELVRTRELLMPLVEE